ncbi:MAG: signal peptidase II [Clostridiales bacterium]|nr:signal peptidase II [Clostridiales bacterium]
MKYLKKNFIGIVLFVAIDQLIKFMILQNCMEANVPLISDLIAFHPIRNTKLSWAGNFFSLSRNPIFLYTLNISAFVLVPLLYNYYWNTSVRETKVGRIFFSMILAGMICSFVDKLGGGSIDYIQIKNLFTFDLKDCYLSIWEASIFIYFVTHWRTMKNFNIRDIAQYYRKKQ